MLWFSFNISYQLVDLQIFSPISVLNLLEFDYNEKIWIYPLQLLNVFELTYWIALAYGISKLAAAAYESMARQPEVAGNIQTAMIIFVGATAIAGAHVGYELICLYHWAKTQR